MKYSRLTPIFLILLFLFANLIVADNHQPQILVIYGSEADQSYIQSIVQDIPVDFSYISVENLQVSDISDQNLIIFAVSDEFSTSDTIEAQLQSYIDNHPMVIITPYLDEFSGDLETKLGIDTIEDTVSSELEELEWTIKPALNYRNFSTSDTYSYSGIATLVNLEAGVQTLASFSNVTGDSDVTGDLEFPYPAIWNTSQGVHVIPTRLTTEDNLSPQQLGLSQIEEFITKLVTDIITFSIQAVQGSGQPGPSENGDSLFPEVNIPPLQLGLISALLALLVLLYSKIVAAINWFARKTYGIMVLVVGAFYNVQDRTMSHSEVMMNTSRTEIIDYLNHVGAYGAHLREIKSITRMGAGSLLWHLQVLEDYNYLEKYSIDSYTIFVADGYTFDYELKEIELQLQSKYTFDLLECLTDIMDETITLSEIEEITGISRRALRRLLKKMGDLGLVRLEKYPEMSVIITKNNKIRELYHSFNLRRTFSFDRENPDVEYIE